MIGDSRTKTSTSGTRLILITLRLATTAPSASGERGDDAHRATSTCVGVGSSSGTPASSRPVGGVAGEGEEDVVEGRAAQPDVETVDASAVELAQRRAAASVAPPRTGAISRACGSSTLDLADRQPRPGPPAPSATSSASSTTTSMRSPPTWAFSSSAVPLGDRPAVVDDDDLVGEPVGLLQVLGGEQQRRAAADQLADDVPQVGAAAGVEAGGRLVEEQHRRLGDERPGQVEPPAHAARVGLHRTVGRPPRGRTARAARAAAPAPAASAMR